MSDKIERQQIVERDELTYDEKERIARKSDHKCAHCGKPVYFGYGATIDHFIPLSKGGTNRDENLIMLCEKCNKDKGNLILYPHDYVTYLDKKHTDRLMGYFKSYVSSFEYIERRNLLACDRYMVLVTPFKQVDYKGRKRSQPQHSSPIKNYVIRAELGDVPRLQAYFIKYLKKYDMLDDIEAAKLNIEFWMRFGCIYYIEKDEEIKLMMTVTATEDLGVAGKVKNYLMANIFSYYNTTYAYTLVKGIMDQIPLSIMEEQALDMIPMCFAMATRDKLTGYVYNGRGEATGNFRYIYILYHKTDEDPLEGENKDVSANNKDSEEALMEFFSKFKDIYAEAETWLKKRDSMSINWMLDELKTKTLFIEEHPAYTAG